MKKLILGMAFFAASMVVGMVACNGVAEATGKGGHHGGGHGGHGGTGSTGGGTTGGNGGSTGGTTSAGASVGNAGVSVSADVGSLVTIDAQAQAQHLNLAPVGLMTGLQARTDTDTKACMSQSDQGLITITRIQANGSFSFSGYEWALPPFARCMKAKGYSGLGYLAEEQTNFGTR